MRWLFKRRESADEQDDAVQTEDAVPPQPLYPECFGSEGARAECADCVHIEKCRYAHSRMERQKALSSLRTKTQELRAYTPSDEESAEAGPVDENTGEHALG